MISICLHSLVRSRVHSFLGDCLVGAFSTTMVTVKWQRGNNSRVNSNSKRQYWVKDSHSKFILGLHRDTLFFCGLFLFFFRAPDCRTAQRQSQEEFAVLRLRDIYCTFTKLNLPLSTTTPHFNTPLHTSCFSVCIASKHIVQNIHLPTQTERWHFNHTVQIHVWSHIVPPSTRLTNGNMQEEANFNINAEPYKMFIAW